MDLNYLFYRQQVEASRAQSAASAAARAVHRALAKAYAQRIAAFQRIAQHEVA